MIVSDPDQPAASVGLVPEYDSADALSWTVYALQGAPTADHHDLGEAEYGLRSAVRTAADRLQAIGIDATAADTDDPRALIEQVLESFSQHRIPDHAPARAVRVLETAAHVDAILTVSAGLNNRSSDALCPLAAVVRSARIAAVSAILHSAWQD